MAKRPSKHLRAPRPLNTNAFARSEQRGDGEWMVQAMSADAATKLYHCPGCGREITPGTPHVVAWPRQASIGSCLLYTSPSPRDRTRSRMPSSA
jgi:hypothetical protein